MKQLLVISGKGGTGKTSLTASLAAMSKEIILADCDVDAADLHLVVNPDVLEVHDFYGGKVAKINPSKCSQCHQCVTHCRFQAIQVELDSLFWDTQVKIDPMLCEGCTLCRYVCPTGAIDIDNNLCGEWFVSDTRFGPLIHAKLGIGEENSGKLVTKVLTTAREIGEREERQLLIVDGPPGIGCPVISSFSGTDLALTVTEPTVSGLHDLERVLDLAKHFTVNCVVCINKADLNREMTQKIIIYCQKNEVEVVGQIPFDKRVTEAICLEMTLWELLNQGDGEDRTLQALKEIYRKVISLIE